MGIKPDEPALARKTLRERDSLPKTPRPQRQHRGTTRQVDDAGAENHQFTKATRSEQSVNVSFNSSSSSKSGPTPKRSRPRKSFKVPTMRTPRSNKNISATKLALSKHQSPVKRQALADVSTRHNQSPNRRHTTVGFNLPDVENLNVNEKVRERRGSFQTVTEGSFGASGLFTSTPADPDQAFLEQKWGRQREAEEETTVEF